MRAMRTSVVLVSLCVVSAAGGEILYDTLWITDTLAYDTGNGNVISGRGVFGSIYDVQLADDFTTDREYVLTRAVADYLTFLGNMPATAVWVQLYEDLGGEPSNEVHADYIAYPDQYSVTSFSDPVFELLGVRLDVDLSAADLTVPAGTWWIDIQPVDITSGGDWYYQVRELGFQDGGDAHGRDGWWWHRDAPWGGGSDRGHQREWVSLEDAGFGAGTAAFRVEGVPEPGTMTLLLWGLVLAARRGALHGYRDR